jgi:hypothetical protein
LVICFGWFCTSLHGVGKQIYLVDFSVDDPWEEKKYWQKKIKLKKKSLINHIMAIKTIDLSNIY